MPGLFRVLLSSASFLYVQWVEFVVSYSVFSNVVHADIVLVDVIPAAVVNYGPDLQRGDHEDEVDEQLEPHLRDVAVVQDEGPRLLVEEVLVRPGGEVGGGDRAAPALHRPPRDGVVVESGRVGGGAAAAAASETSAGGGGERMTIFVGGRRENS